MTTPRLSVEPLPPDASYAMEHWFNALDELTRAGLTRIGPDGTRATLEELGTQHSCTREWVRQKQSSGRTELLTTLSLTTPRWLATLRDELTRTRAARFRDVAERFGGGPFGDAAAWCLLSTLKWSPYGSKGGWWVSDGEWVAAGIQSMQVEGPITEEEWSHLALSSGIPKEILDQAEIPSVGQWLPFRGHRVRSRRERVDKAVVVLREKGPMLAQELATEIQVDNARALDGSLSRDDRFVRLPKLGWNLAEAVDGPIYSSALPAVIDILRESGPMERAELSRAVAAVHPVTDWRIQQILDNVQIGYMPDGKVWLVEYGATRPSESEPARPDTMVEAQGHLGVRLTVTRDHLRGSGFFLHGWLAWKLGLRASPEAITFTPASHDFDETVTVTRNGGQSNMSAIRTILEHLSLVEGCEVALLLAVAPQTWSLMHVCDSSSCPAMNDDDLLGRRFGQTQAP